MIFQRLEVTLLLKPRSIKSEIVIGGALSQKTLPTTINAARRANIARRRTVVRNYLLVTASRLPSASMRGY